MDDQPNRNHLLVSNLPFSAWLPFVIGGAYGLLLRLIFSGNGVSSLPDVMAGAFVYAVPFAVGAITIYLAEQRTRRSWLFYAFAPWLSVGLFVGGAGLALIEGLICIVMALPLFLILGSAGGLVMGLICRFRNRPLRTVQSISLLPLVLLLGEGLIPAGDRISGLERSLYIAAPPSAVWQLILNPSDIRPDELAGGLAYRIGVPYPIQARTQAEGVGGLRRSTWASGVSFDERITAWQPNRYIAWRYEFHPDSFPPGTMDEHVVIGGEYFDLLDSAYQLIPEAGGTRLQLRVNFRTSTKFNWYAQPLARLMLGDTAEVLLGFYKQRAEAQVAAVTAAR
nr:hypothetical protein [uncultured Pseudomonas sp.]